MKELIKPNKVEYNNYSEIEVYCETQTFDCDVLKCICRGQTNTSSPDEDDILF